MQMQGFHERNLSTRVLSQGRAAETVVGRRDEVNLPEPLARYRVVARRQFDGTQRITGEIKTCCISIPVYKGKSC